MCNEKALDNLKEITDNMSWHQQAAWDDHYNEILRILNEDNATEFEEI